ncbi:MAG: radical SAM protein [Anaerolineales bacterium]
MNREKLLGLPQWLQKLKSARQPEVIPAGLYHFPRIAGNDKTRLHLRIDPDGSGTLLINASSILYLNQTASLIAYHHFNERGLEVIQQLIDQTFDSPPENISEQIQLIIRDLESFIKADGAPVNTYSGVEINTPFSQHPSAPYRMDLALTYRCNNDCQHCYNARLRTYPELSTVMWKNIIDRCWELNIPHLIFTGGEPTLREDLPELIRHAEGNGQITGLNTNGRRLQDKDFIQQLVDAGLDHVQITLESHNAEIHDKMVNLRGAWKQTVAGLENAIDSPLFVMTNTTMLQDNYQSMDQTLDFLGELNVPTVGLNALIYSGRGKDVGTGLSEEELKPLLTLARQKTEAQGQKLIWYTPTLYCHFNPLEMDLGVKGCTAALYNMCIEPDGGVIPCQSYYHQLGNLLDDSWKSIWEHDLALSLRERSNIPGECQVCSLLEECGAGCPLAYAEQPRILEPIIPPAN